MLTEQDLPNLRAAAAFFSVRRRLETSAVIGMITGLLLIVLAFAAFAATGLKAVMLIMGAVLFLGGLCGIGAPGLSMLLGLGMLMLLGGLYSVFIAIDGILRHADKTPPSGVLVFWALLALVLIARGLWDAFYGLPQYKSGLAAPLGEQAAEALEIIEDIVAADPGQEAEAVVFTAMVSPQQTRQWSGRLLDGIGVFARGKGSRFVIVKKEDVRLETAAAASEAGNVAAALALGDELRARAEMSAGIYDRFMAWKAEAKSSHDEKMGGRVTG